MKLVTLIFKLIKIVFKTYQIQNLRSSIEYIHMYVCVKWMASISNLGIISLPSFGDKSPLLPVILH